MTSIQTSFKTQRGIYMRNILVVFFIVAGFYSNAQTTGTITDPRDGQLYSTASFENSQGVTVTWMAQNLNFKTDSGSWAYGNNESYRKKLGLLYNYETALNVCPSGWHLPTVKEWEDLIEINGGIENAGLVLKGRDLWSVTGKCDLMGNYPPIGGGSNQSKFDALPGGQLEGIEDDIENFSMVQDLGGWLASYIPNMPKVVFLNKCNNKVRIGFPVGKTMRLWKSECAYSVRCVKN
jgi:uncharacterized protein (TIGR02145 family)